MNYKATRIHLSLLHPHLQSNSVNEQLGKVFCSDGCLHTAYCLSYSPLLLWTSTPLALRFSGCPMCVMVCSSIGVKRVFFGWGGVGSIPQDGSCNGYLVKLSTRRGKTE